LELPCEPAPGFGGILLGAILARFHRDLDEDTVGDVAQLLSDVERGRRIAQPRARHRLQEDRVGLRPCRHRLLGVGDALVFDLDDARGTSAQHVLDAVYAIGSIPDGSRRTVVAAMRRGLRWHGEIDASLAAHLAGGGDAMPTSASADPVAWAMRVLCLIDDRRTSQVAVSTVLPSRQLVQQAFRARLRAAHPDHGADDDGAAQRIAELAEARRILLG
ncbi:MAG: hypothetical protein JST64_05390, partial [Actinobacteria bacterium]|nr:hypothetical protein [Actinomycetota bacterium]